MIITVSTDDVRRWAIRAGEVQAMVLNAPDQAMSALDDLIAEMEACL